MYHMIVLYVSFRAIVRALCAFLFCSTAYTYCQLLSITILSKWMMMNLLNEVGFLVFWIWSTIRYG